MSTGAEPQLHAIVLAAGAASRFGSPKQLARVDGRPMLHTVVSHAVGVAGHSVTVVLGAHAAELAPLLRHTPAAIVLNRDWAEGMGSSLRSAVERLPGAADGALVLLADQIAVTAGDLQRLVGAWRRNPDSIAAASYGGVLGVPAIFPRWCLPALAELRGDQGARAVLRRHADRVQRILMPNAAIDIDRPEDLLDVEARRRGGGDRAADPAPPDNLTA